MQKTIRFPRGIEINLNNIPQDFDAIIAKAFAEFTHGTAKAYTYQDKLNFIDLCRKYAHNTDFIDIEMEVNGLIKGRFASELDESGEIAGADTFFSVDFMEYCFDMGGKAFDCDLYDHFTGDHRVDDKIMELLYRAIKVVMEWEG